MNSPVTSNVTVSNNRYCEPVIVGKLPGPLLVRCILWLLLFAVFPLSVTAATLSFQTEVLGCTPYPIALPPGSSESLPLAEHVLAYLEVCEKKEADPWLRDDIRIAWVTVLYASRGNSQPHVDATYQVLGLHPDKVWPAILARREALLGPHGMSELSRPVASSASLDPVGLAQSPKKPCASERRIRARKEAAA